MSLAVRAPEVTPSSTVHALFGDSTFRLVHGSDIAATVPPAGLFRHVGQLIQCDSGRPFTSQTPNVGSRQTTNPRWLSWWRPRRCARHRRDGAINPSIGTRPVAQTARGLLRIFRDHVPDNYFRALSVTIG
jgi:hypothetical protein